jgi:predicted 3-demethylubiquinone-9 3-methyltransferase (glyoxalase superfamily)
MLRLFPDSEVTAVYRSPMDNPGNKAGDVSVVRPSAASPASG